ncbi:MAG: Fe-S cluster assembly protein SufD, partial [Prochlorococcaceae cyanobacterium ETNP1_MAG_9]|nr:Fe-S cluster assembly protein SufD [Prochlorococcaceae cyanobacterium ETNP1_MAG_9]
MALCRQWLDALPVPQGVLKNVQEDGRETLLTMGLPTKDLEAWRLTDLNRFRKLLELPTFKKTSESRKFNSDAWAHPPKEGIRIVLEPENNNSESINLPTGIRRLSSSELKEHLNKNFN